MNPPNYHGKPIARTAEEVAETFARAVAVLNRSEDQDALRVAAGIALALGWLMGDEEAARSLQQFLKRFGV